MRDLLVPVQRLMVSTAQVGESAAGALTSLLDGGTQLVTASTSVVRAASVNTLSVAQAAWEGVDLIGMNATNVIGRGPWSKCSSHRAVAVLSAGP